MKYTDRAWAEINLSALRSNLRTLRQLGHHEVMGVVKANAYGHGLAEIAMALQKEKVCWFGIARVSEGISLRLAGITSNILMLCPATPSEYKDLIEYKITPILGDSTAIDLFVSHKPDTQYPVHLDIETGMGRSGILPEEAVLQWKRATSLGLFVNGICSHYHSADCDNIEDTLAQKEIFEKVYRELKCAGAQLKYIHLENSPSLLGKVSSSITNMVRPGLLLYGISPPNSSGPIMEPVFSLKARVGSVRRLPKGHTISYGATHILSRDSTVATVMIGYGDGYPRRLSNSGSVLLHDHKVSILGRVCMDQCVVDVTDICSSDSDNPVQVGDIATLIGKDRRAQISVEEIATLIDTTEHEITTGISPLLPRVYLD